MNHLQSTVNDETSLFRWSKVLVLLLGLLPAAGFAGSNFVSRFLERDVQVITVTDVAPAGKSLRVPTRAKPMYYEALVIGYSDVGRTIANLNPPKKDDMVKLIMKLLADQGYFPATPKHAPEVLLSFEWGTLNGQPATAMQFMGGGKLDVLWELDSISIHNASRWLTRDIRSPEASFVVECSYSDLYIISIGAYDEEKAKNGHIVQLWQTKVSCPAAGLDMGQSLKQMARQAAPYFGRETSRPVWTSAPERQGQVDIRELRVMEAINTSQLPITDLHAEAPEASAKKP
jgi:hypothetical protein